MKKSTIIILVAVALLVIWGVTGYNRLVSMEENVNGQWSNVETQYQRRADLIPNLVNTVKGYASHEKETLEGVIQARSQATQITVDAANLTPEKLAEYQKAQGAVTSALGKLLAVSERYPELKANQNFLNCKPSWKVRRTASTWHALTSIMPPKLSTPASAASRTTCLPECSDSRNALTSKLPKEPNKHPRWSSEDII